MFSSLANLQSDCYTLVTSPLTLNVICKGPHAVVILNKMMKPLQEANIFNMPSFYVRGHIVQSVPYGPLKRLGAIF